MDAKIKQQILNGKIQIQAVLEELECDKYIHH